MKLGDGAGLVDGVGADAGEDADLARTLDRLGELADGHRILGVVEEGCLNASCSKRLGKDVPHAAARLEALHVLRAGNEVRAILCHPGKVDQLSGEEALEVVPLAQLVSLLGELAQLLAVKVRLGIDDEKRATQNDCFHTELPCNELNITNSS